MEAYVILCTNSSDFRYIWRFELIQPGVQCIPGSTPDYYLASKSRKSSLKINNVGFVLWESHNISPSFGFTGQTPGSEFDFWFFPLSLQIRPTLGGFSGYCLFSGYPMFSTALTGNLSVLIDIHVLPLNVCLIGVRVRTNSLGLDRIMS